MALDLSNLELFLGQLAQAVSEGFAEHARVERHGTSVISVEINLDSDVFRVHRDGQRFVAQHRRIVRGITLKTNTLVLDRWVEQLTLALARHANENARAAWLLNQLNGRA
jgi:hypothetical protein